MNPDQAAEVELVAQAAAGNMGAFAQLVAAYRLRVVRVASGLLGSTADAEDVAQEVFLKAWHNLPHYHPQGSMASWLYRITVNAAIDLQRKRRAESPLNEQERDPGDSPEQTLLDHDRQERLRSAVAALPEGARAALILREYEGLSYREIADALQLPLGTVMSRLNYARQLLRRQLTEGDVL